MQKKFLGKKIDLAVERLGINGEGVGQWQGFTVFVDEALPGETITAEVIEEHKTFCRAKRIATHTASPHREAPICPHFSACGGCQLMHLAYSEQLQAKRQRVVDALERIGKFQNVMVHPCIASPSTLGYRNKIQLPARSKGGQLRFGLYAHKSHDLVEFDHCFIHQPLGEKVRKEAEKILKSFSITAYHPETGQGELRHILIKTAPSTQQTLIILVTQHPKSATLVRAAEEILRTIPEVSGVIHNHNPTQGNVILGDTFQTLCGQDAIEEILCGFPFKVSPASFFQVNPAQAEQLYQKVIEWANLQGNEVVLDAYCGVGTLSLILSKKAKQVIGIECVSDAVRDAIDNAKKNGITNASFLLAHAEDSIHDLGPIDLAVINPPRKGCERSFLEKLLQLQPAQILYISCDPATLARDLQILCQENYRIEQAQPFDMFPQTAHVECLVRLRLISV